MKKNVFSRTMAVLASMAVLGAASMMTANAGSSNTISISDKEIELGQSTVEVTIDCESVADDALGYTVEVTWPEGLEFVSAANGSAMVSAGDVNGNSVAITGFAMSPIVGASATLTFNLPADYTSEDSWEIGLTASKYGPSANYDSFEAVGGTITVKAEETAAPTQEPTVAPTAAPTQEATAAPVVTTVAAATTAKKTDSPKTGSTGVAVAAAGLVVAGATAVVLKKKN